MVMRTHTPAQPEWKEFWMRPPFGKTIKIDQESVHAEGITLAGMIAVAYEIPAARIIGPEWIHTRLYSLSAASVAETPEEMHALLKKELIARFRLRTHLEQRPFQVYVLRAGQKPQLERVEAEIDAGTTNIHEWDLSVRQETMQQFATVLESVVNKPVIDETGLKDAYNIEIAWGEHRAQTLAAALDQHLGLRLTPETRQIEALVVDRIEPEPVLSMFAGIGKLASHAPRMVRLHLARVFSVH